MNKRIAHFMTGALVFSVLIVLIGCQAVFTFSPVSFLQRDPSKLSLDQKKTYAEDALASGDSDAMLAAYNAIKDDATGSTDGELNLLAAKLAMELSGVPDLLNQVLSGDIDLSASGGSSDFDALLAELNTSFLVEAAGFYTDADTNGANLNSTDYLLGAACILIESCTDPLDLGTAAAQGEQDAQDFLMLGINALPDGDPAKDILQGFWDFIPQP